MTEVKKDFSGPIGVLLYSVCSYFAGKKKPMLLATLIGTHLCEYLFIARGVAKSKNIDQLVALANCICFGFGWWLPIKKGE